MGVTGGDSANNARDEDEVIDLTALESVQVIVHCRHRFFREGLASLLSAEPGITVVATAVTIDEIEGTCTEHEADIVLVDLVGAAEDDLQFALDLEEHRDGLRCVVLCNEPRLAREARRAGLRAVVVAQEGAQGVLHALRSDDFAAPASTVLDTSSVLTPREVEVLEFIGEGCTTWEVSKHLGISRKTVENHKQRIFAKLDVQNQAHAIAVAVRRGFIDVDGERRATSEASS